MIDDDLGAARGALVRPGFVAWLCAGDVGAVLCFDAWRLARNRRDWHHLLELCGLVDASVVDQDGVYNPCSPNDRLLLGMKGTISEFELGIIRARMLDAGRAKASRGELRISVPIGYIWYRDAGLGFDPDLRVQEAVRLIFSRFREVRSGRQVLLSLTEDKLCFPRPTDGRSTTTFDWTPIRYRNVISVLKNPFYAGVYAYGKSEKRTEIIDGRAPARPMAMANRRRSGNSKITTTGISNGTNMNATRRCSPPICKRAVQNRAAVRCFLGSFLRSLRAAPVRRLYRQNATSVYRCERPNLMLGLNRCLGFGGPRIDKAVVAELLRVVQTVWQRPC